MNSRFVFQDNQYRGDILPCTLDDFNRIVDNEDVAWRIGMRQQVERAIAEQLPLDGLTTNGRFQGFCKKHSDEASFQKLTMELRLLQWANWLKMGLPCFIFGASDFDLAPVTDKDGQPVVGANGEPLMKRRRQLAGIRLSGLFMFDADHLPMDPRQVYERTLKEGFHWLLRLAHRTSSGHGLRLVCEARPEVGNIADNQIELARELGLLGVTGTTGKPVTDNSCIDASRISYSPRREDIFFIDNDKLFNN